MKDKPIRNKHYITWIKQCPCLLCLNPATEAHHVNPVGKGAKGSKTDDTRCIPLCTLHHLEYHQIGRDSFSKKHSIDYEYVIERLNKIYEGNDKMD